MMIIRQLKQTVSMLCPIRTELSRTTWNRAHHPQTTHFPTITLAFSIFRFQAFTKSKSPQRLCVSRNNPQSLSALPTHRYRKTAPANRIGTQTQTLAPDRVSPSACRWWSRGGGNASNPNSCLGRAKKYCVKINGKKKKSSSRLMFAISDECVCV